jgi:ankyrin repeat protein
MMNDMTSKIMKKDEMKNNFSGNGVGARGNVTPLMRKEEIGVTKIASPGSFPKTQVTRAVEPLSSNPKIPSQSPLLLDNPLIQNNGSSASIFPRAIYSLSSSQVADQARSDAISNSPAITHSANYRNIDRVTNTNSASTSNPYPNNLFAMDANGNSALILAVYSNNLSLIRELVEKHRLPLNLQNFDGETALSVAVMNNNYEIAKFLIERGADLNTSNCRCESPLHQAVVLGNMDIIRLLLDGGSYMDSEDECGETPLHFAVREDQVEVVDYLLSVGADADHSNQDDETPAELADMVASQEVKQVFIENCKRYVEGKSFHSNSTSSLGSKSHLLLKKSQQKLTSSTMLSPLSASLSLPRFFMDHPNSSE